VLNINEAPIAVNFTSTQSPEVFENTTTGSALGTLLALDSDANQDLTFSLDDDSEGEFSLDPSGPSCQSLANDRNKTKCTVRLLLAKPLNYEINTVRFISIRVTDTHGLFRVQKFAINVLDCNDAPTNIVLNGGVSAVVRENSGGAFVGELRTSDEDSSQNWTYHILNDYGKFKIVGKYIYVNKGSHLNYEDKSTYVLTVKSLDNGVPAYGVSRNFTIVVADVNEVPTKITLSNKEIFENSSPGTVIANLTVTDPDNQVAQRQTHYCSVIGQNKLRIYSGRLVNSVALDFERTPVVNVSIECTDSGTPRLKYKEDFTVIVKDRNEAPTDIILSNLLVLENQDAGVIGEFKTCFPPGANIEKAT
jgi:VCBS repeat-containing protein